MSTESLHPGLLKKILQRRSVRWILLILALSLFGSILSLGYVWLDVNREWAVVQTETDQQDPRWRLGEIEADRPNLADADNSAILINGWNSSRIGLGIILRWDESFKDQLPERQLNVKQIDLLRSELAKVGKAIQEARRLKDLLNGRFHTTFTDDWFSTRAPFLEEVDNTANWLLLDSWLLAQDKQSDSALQSCQAVFNAGRSIKDDAMVVGHYRRSRIQLEAISALERVIAQGQFSDEQLQTMQAVLEKEIIESSWLRAVRGERAGQHHLFANIRAGKVPRSWFFKMGHIGGPQKADGTPTDIVMDQLPSTLLAYYPESLRHMNRAVEIAKLPIHERKAKYEEWEQFCKATGNPVIRMLAPSMTRPHEYECRSQAALRCAVAGVACERYRLAHGHWPASLNAVGNLEDHYQVDPLDGRPLRFRRHAEGIVVYSVGFDLSDDEGKIDDNWGRPGTDIGFRLWDVPHRRQPPVLP